ncbi:MAG: hypothetical protein ACO1NO_12695 [Burkholderiaceae bacterium]
MNSIAKLLALAPFLLYSASSFAIYKCEANGKIIYSDEECTEGRAKAIDTTNSQLSDSAANEAAARSKREKEALKLLEEKRRKEEVLEEKARQKKLRAEEALNKKCQAMALKVKWSEEDASAATGKSAEKSKRTAHRNREKYEAECGKH